MLTRATLMILVALNFIQLSMLIVLSNYIANRMVFDIDTVRNNYVKSLRYNYHDACRIGVDRYPPEYRTQLVIGFNPNSSMVWCGEQAKMKEAEWVEEAIKNVR